MVYLDTNVLIYASVEQDPRKHREAIDLIEALVEEERLLLSTLVMQEFVFTLAKLGVPYEMIRHDSEFYMAYVALGVDQMSMKRAVESCLFLQKCRNVNDILHLYLAEKAGAKRVMSYDRDFKALKTLGSPVEIEIL